MRLLAQLTGSVNANNKEGKPAAKAAGKEIWMGIGTLSERCLHAALKRYLEPDENCHEQSCGSYVADILKDGKVVEIQTKGFHRLRDKLDYYLTEHEVTIVYPIDHRKTLIWVDPETGERHKPRKSPKIGVIQELFRELIYLRPYLNHPNLTFRVILVDVEEYRLLNGWSKDRKKGSERAERIPTAIVADRSFSKAVDWFQMLPETLSDSFTAKELGNACHISPSCAQRAVTCLKIIGVIKHDGKKGRAYLYRRTDVD